MSAAFDLAIVGSGFGGSLTAMVARRLGLSVVMLERGTHPRFAIGESSSPLANLLLEQLARRYDLPRLIPLTEYGKWRRAYPEIGRGLKRGFSFYAHTAGQPFFPREDRTSELLVAASPSDEVADTHWLRADFDHFLVREAQSLGVEHLDQVVLDGIHWKASGEAELTGRRQGQTLVVQARYVVDATGPRGFLSRALSLPESALPTMPPTQGLFTHFVNVPRWADLHPPQGFPPYPPDDAALHHMFDGGWIWVLRFENGVTSAGAAVTERLAEELRLSEGAPAWDRLLARFPSVREHLEDGEPIRPFVYSPRLPYRSAQWSGPGWTLLPSAAAFVDPLFSTGIPLTLLGIERFGQALEKAWGTPEFDAQVAHGAALSAREVEATARLVGASYAGFHDFPRFASLSMFYFAAASHSEMARRLGETGVQAFRRSGVQGSTKASLTPTLPILNTRTPERLNARAPEHLSHPLFLRVDHPTFGPGFERLSESLLNGDGGSSGSFAAAVRDAIEPLNVAGLCDPGKRNWYPVRMRDLIENAAKLGMSGEAMAQWIEAAGWAALA
jgi:FADH2 O2-dependent halogenase